MKPTHPLILAVLFSTAFSIAWMLRSGQEPPEQGGEDTRKVSRLGAVHNPSRQDDDARTKSLVRDYLEGRSPVIAKNDYRKLIKELIRNLDGEEEYWLQKQVEKLVSDWYEADPDAALHWVLGQKEADQTASLLTAIIGRLAGNDLEAALAMAKRYGADDGRHLEMPEQIQEGLSKINAEDLLRIVGLFTQEGGESGVNVEFADGFDFQRALDGLAEMAARLKQQEASFARTPANLLSEWAKRDWDAAWQWAISGKNVEYNGLSDLIKDMAEVTTQEEYAGMAAFVAGLPDRDPRFNGWDVWSILAERSSPELIASFLEQAPGERQENLSRILVASSGFSGGNYDAAQEVFLSQMTPAERLAAFQSEAFVAFLNEPRLRVPEIYEHTQEKYSSLLRRLGHSDEEIARILPPAPKE